MTRTRIQALIVPWLVAACAPATVRLEARVSASREDPVALPGARVVVRDHAFERLVDGVTDADGRVSLDVPAQAEIHVVVQADGAAPSAFRGETGAAPVFAVPDGTLWAVPEAEIAAWRARFAGCPGAEGASTLVVGQLRVAIAIEDVGQAGIADQGFAYVSDVADPTLDRRDACYLDAEGEAWDPEADYAGPSGLFALFGVEGGPWALTLGRFVTGGTAVGRRTLYVPEDGVVSLHPALVPL